MTIVKGYIDTYWHERHLMILVLNRGPMRKNQLFDEIRGEQRKRMVLGEKEVAHSKSAYNYWVNSRRSQWVLSKHGSILQLTPIGKWIANSTLGNFFQRDDFIHLICSKCAKPGHLALLEPLLHTAQTNAKGILFMDLQCPRCQNCISRMPVSEILSEEEFIQFYHKALRELQRITKGQSLAVE